MVDAVHAGRGHSLGPLEGHVAGVENQPGLGRNRHPHGADQREQAVKVELVHRHEKEGVQVAAGGEGERLLDHLVARQLMGLDEHVAGAEHAEVTAAGTGRSLHADLPEEHRLAAEATLRDRVCHAAQQTGLQRVARQVEETEALLAAGRRIAQRAVEDGIELRVDLRSSAWCRARVGRASTGASAWRGWRWPRRRARTRTTARC